MSIHVALRHRTAYTFDRPVSLSTHLVRLKPAAHCRTPIEAYSLKVEPKLHFIHWQQDPFGNYLCQKLLEYCTPAQRLQIVKKISGYLVSISVNMHGTRAAQKLIDCLRYLTQRLS